MKPAAQLDRAKRIDALCDRFEHDWKAGKAVRIEQFVGKMDESLRSQALQALVEVEIELRRTKGETPSLGEYVKRFPGQEQTIKAAFHTSKRQASAAAQDTPASGNRTQTATISARRIEVKELSAAQEAGFVRLFNGNDLTGWAGITKHWRVDGGAIVGEVPQEGLPKNLFLSPNLPFPLKDFELRLEVKMVKGNSGIQVRSRRVDDHNFTTMVGPQFEIAHGTKWTWSSLLSAACAWSFAVFASRNSDRRRSRRVAREKQRSPEHDGGRV